MCRCAATLGAPTRLGCRHGGGWARDLWVTAGGCGCGATAGPASSWVVAVAIALRRCACACACGWASASASACRRGAADWIGGGRLAWGIQAPRRANSGAAARQRRRCLCTARMDGGCTAGWAAEKKNSAVDRGHTALQGETRHGTLCPTLGGRIWPPPRRRRTCARRTRMLRHSILYDDVGRDPPPPPCRGAPSTAGPWLGCWRCRCAAPPPWWPRGSREASDAIRALKRAYVDGGAAGSLWWWRWWGSFLLGSTPLPPRAHSLFRALFPFLPSALPSPCRAPAEPLPRPVWPGAPGPMSSPCIASATRWYLGPLPGSTVS
jgi:hypothetical protein